MEDTFYYSNKISTTVRSKDVLQLFSDAMLIGVQNGIKLVEEISPEAAFKIAFHRFCTPRSPGKIRSPFDQFTDLPLTKVGNHHLKVFHFGEKDLPTVLLVHGWTGRASDFAFFIEPLLKAGFRVVTFDLPAHGESLGRQTNALEVSELIQDLNELEGPFEAVIGHSFGGFTSSIAFSKSKKLKNKKLITMGTPNRLKKVLNDFGNILKLSQNIRKKLQVEIENRFERSIENISTAEFINESRADALIIHDKKDRLVSFQDKVDMVEHIDRVSHLETEGLGHTRILYNEDVIARVIEFLGQK